MTAADGLTVTPHSIGDPWPGLRMKEPISLVVTDLDGTLWDRDGRVHDLTLDARRELDRRGLPVLAATARRLAQHHLRPASEGGWRAILEILPDC